MEITFCCSKNTLSSAEMVCSILSYFQKAWNILLKYDKTNCQNYKNKYSIFHQLLPLLFLTSKILMTF